MEKINITELTLKTPVYHPFYGEGRISEIKDSQITVNFEDRSLMEFSTTGGEDTRFIQKELFLEPVSIQSVTFNK